MNRHATKLKYIPETYIRERPMFTWMKEYWYRGFVSVNLDSDGRRGHVWHFTYRFSATETFTFSITLQRPCHKDVWLDNFMWIAPASPDERLRFYESIQPILHILKLHLKVALNERTKQHKEIAEAYESKGI